ncbi:MAG: hypothetical protein FWD71_18075 [Oscillospiraceae bacterium]|nr:hypothetical protein [Oscillospiraceae bacterium]
MNGDILNKLIEKLIKDTKSDNIKWSKSEFEKYAIDREKYITYIDEIGKIYISKTKNNEVYFSISEKEETAVNDSEDIKMTIDYNSIYYVDMMRLYNLINSGYMAKLSTGSLEKAITAYINRPN